MDTYFKYKLDYLVIIALSFPILFLKLGSFSLRLWDESIYATNSIEMMERGEWIVPYFNGEMDYWNTKPPMINWLQIISMKIFGINEMAIRIPSALAALATLLIVYWFIKKHFNSITGFAASMVLLTSVGFVTFHGARTGDTDALLTFFMTACNLLVLNLILTNKISTKKLIGIFLSILLGFLTKSVAVFLFLPALLVYFVIYEKTILRQLLSNKYFWILSSTVLFVIIGFVLLRNNLQPGYLNLIFSSEIGRIGSTIENHNEPFQFYIDNLMNPRFSYWIIFFMTSFLLLFNTHLEEKAKKLIRFVSCLSIFYFLFITLSVTKLFWYDIPLFPLLALNISLLIRFIIEKINLSFIKSFAIIIILFLLPYKHVFGLSQANHYNGFEMKNEVKERYLKKYYDEIHETTPKRLIIFHDGYERSIFFYKKMFEQKNIEIIITNNPDLRKGDLFLIEKNNFNDDYRKFNITYLEQFENLLIYKIK